MKKEIEMKFDFIAKTFLVFYAVNFLLGFLRYLKKLRIILDVNYWKKYTYKKRLFITV